MTFVLEKLVHSEKFKESKILYELIKIAIVKIRVSVIFTRASTDLFDNNLSHVGCFCSVLIACKLAFGVSLLTCIWPSSINVNSGCYLLSLIFD